MIRHEMADVVNTRYLAYEHGSLELELAEIERIVNMLDSWFVIPGTNVRVGLDAIVGLVPALGDIAMLLASLYVVDRLSRLGLSGFTRARMFANVFIDFVIGAIPVLGDFFDIAFRANVRNLEIARRALNA